MTPRVAVIVQARMASTRLPGKVMLPVNGRPLLDYLLERLERVRWAYNYTVAVPDTETEFAGSIGHWHMWQVVQGSELDVLARFRDAAQAAAADIIVRVTADCPLIDPATVDASIAYLISGGYDHVAPEGLPDGMGCDVFTRELLETSAHEADTPEDREHVTLWALRRPSRFRLGKLWYGDMPKAFDVAPSTHLFSFQQPDAIRRRWTVDTAEDFALVARIINALYPDKPDFGYSDILTLLDANPTWERVNRDVEARPVDRTPVSNVTFGSVGSPAPLRNE